MGNSRLRCACCRGYFPAEGAYRRNGLSSFCSEDCFREHSRRPATIVERKATRPKKKSPSLDTKLRRRVKNRDGNRCMICSTHQRLHVHHVHYRSEGGSDETHNLITLCQTDHDRVHSSKRTWQPILLACLWIKYVERRKVNVPETIRYLMKKGLLERDPLS